MKQMINELKFTRRACVAIGAAAIALAAASVAAQPAFPQKPVRLVVGFAPGGGSDLLTRAISTEMGEALGQPVVIDNKAGAAGLIANEIIAKAPADGYSLVVGSAATFSIIPNMMEKPPYDALKDYAAVSPFARNTFMLVAHPGLPANNVAELIDYARANPGALNFGSAGNGSVMHLAMEMFASMAGIRLTHVPYKSAGPALLDVVAGRVQLFFNTTGITVPYAQSGKLKVLASSTSRRAALFPNVPTLSEAGVKGYELFNWFGIFAPAGTPRPAIERLNRAVNSALAQPKVLERIRSAGAEEYSGTADELAAQVRVEFEKYGKLVRGLGLKAE